jgi:hypothetical protein
MSDAPAPTTPAGGPLRRLRDLYLRVDARSLGLFRWAFGLVLIADLVRRWRWLRELYSNDGVLPNHAHLFGLRDIGRVFSIYHPFSTPGENHFAFALTLAVYAAFLVGWHTRVFHALSLLCLVSLTGRNILLENAGNYAAIALLAFTVFLPCGSRLSIDSLRARLADGSATGAEPSEEEEVQAGRLPGWSPVSLAALAVLLQIALIYLCSALQSNGASWRSGTALYYALHVERWVSALGVHLRTAPPGLLSRWTQALLGIEYAVPVLIALPIPWRRIRELAAVLMLLHGLTLGLLFSFGLYAWTLCASAALLLPKATWDAFARSAGGARLRARFDATLARLQRRGVLATPDPGAEPEPYQPSPARRVARGVEGLLREAAVGILLAAMLLQTDRANVLPVPLVRNPPRALAAVAEWPRMLARWDILTDPPAEDALLVMEAQTKGGQVVDPLTGAPPVQDPSSMRGTGLGQLWNDYLVRIRELDVVVFPARDHPESVRTEFQKQFRDYAAKAGPRWQDRDGDDALVGLDAYWVKQPILPPGAEGPPAAAARSKVFTIGRGGRLPDKPATADRAAPPADKAAATTDKTATTGDRAATADQVVLPRAKDLRAPVIP